MSTNPNFFPEDDSPTYICKICLSEAQRKEVIAPCDCRGSCKWVHRSCLDQWRTTKEDRAFGRCTECLRCYTLISLSKDVSDSARKRYRKYIWLVIRDFGGAFALIQTCIILTALFIYGCDHNKHFLHAFKMENHPIVFYYGMGLLLDLAIIGFSTIFASSNQPYYGGYGYGYNNIIICNNTPDIDCGECGHGIIK